MKFSDYISEMSSMISATREELKDYNYNYIGLKKLEKKATIEGYYEYKNIYKYANNVGKNTIYFVLDDDTKTVLFYSTISKISGSLYKGEVEAQTFIYQESSFKGAADYIFMRVILENHKTILSDSQQTKGGRHFWKKMFDKYKGSRNYEIGYYDGLDKRYIPYRKDDSDEEFNANYEGQNEHYNRQYIKLKD